MSFYVSLVGSEARAAFVRASDDFAALRRIAWWARLRGEERARALDDEVSRTGRALAWLYRAYVERAITLGEVTELLDEATNPFSVMDRAGVLSRARLNALCARLTRAREGQGAARGAQEVVHG